MTPDENEQYSNNNEMDFLMDNSMVTDQLNTPTPNVLHQVDESAITPYTPGNTQKPTILLQDSQKEQEMMVDQ